jgi:hypothetical protein
VDGVREVTVAEDAVAVERVAVSRVLEEKLEPGGERDCCWPRAVCGIDEIVKERGSVDEGLRSARNVKLDDGPRVCDDNEARVVGRSTVLAGIASSDVGGSPR